jgi:hypothetical protein
MAPGKPRYKRWAQRKKRGRGSKCLSVGEGSIHRKTEIQASLDKNETFFTK